MSHKNHYSPLRYPGGKTVLFPFFDDFIRLNEMKGLTYIEPFAGGAGAALSLLILDKVDSIVINDLDRAIYSFWTSVINETDRFIEKIQKTSIDISEWKIQKDIYKNSISSVFDLGFATFFLNRTNVSGIIGAGPIGGKNQLSKWQLDVRFKKDNLIEKIHKLAQYKKRIKVTNRDGLEVIKTYITKSNAFIYIDPPYFDKGATLYLNHYKLQDHVKLANLLNNHEKANWILTYDDKPEIKELYMNRRFIPYKLNHSANVNRKGNEIMIFSDSMKIPPLPFASINETN